MLPVQGLLRACRMVGALCVSIAARITGIWDGVDKVPPRAHCMTGFGDITESCKWFPFRAS